MGRPLRVLTEAGEITITADHIIDILIGDDEGQKATERLQDFSDRAKKRADELEEARVKAEQEASDRKAEEEKALAEEERKRDEAARAEEQRLQKIADDKAAAEKEERDRKDAEQRAVDEAKAEADKKAADEAAAKQKEEDDRVVAKRRAAEEAQRKDNPVKGTFSANGRRAVWIDEPKIKDGDVVKFTVIEQLGEVGELSDPSVEPGKGFEVHSVAGDGSKYEYEIEG